MNSRKNAILTFQDRRLVIGYMRGTLDSPFIPKAVA